MKRYIAKRLLMLIPVMLGVSVISFSLMHLAPGDPARALAGEHASKETLEKIREKYRLNDPLYVQYWIWLEDAVQGDLGRSIKTQELVTKEIWARFPNTVELSVCAMIIAVVVGVIAGIISATKQYSVFDYSFMTAALFGVSMPVFWLGIMLMLIFGLELDLLPIAGRVDYGVELQRITNFLIVDSIITGNLPALKSVLSHLILPSVALATIPMAFIARMTRSSMLEVLRQDFIRTERAKGLSERMVVYKHAVRNAMIPVLTVIGMNFGLLLAGAILTETVFGWPGIGRYVVDAVYMRDYPAVIGTTLFFAVIFVIVNLVTDVLYAYADPRIHYE